MIDPMIRQPVPEIEAAAFGYADLGLRVIALTGKMPNGLVHRNGLYDALTGVDTTSKFDRAFQHPETTGVGILTGPVYYVVDIDGEEGAAQWKDMVGDDYMPDRWVAKTGRGLHLWYASYEQWPTVKLGPKLDFKGVGGYVAAPPSQHPDGHRYEWMLEPDIWTGPPRELPDELALHLSAAKFAKERAKHDAITKVRNREALAADGTIQNTQSFAGIIQVMTEAPDGNRNNVLNWAAYTMASDGADREDFAALSAAAEKAGLSPHEVKQTINSALRAFR